MPQFTYTLLLPQKNHQNPSESPEQWRRTLLCRYRCT